MPNEPSKRLVKIGLLTISDNLKPGQEVVFNKAFTRIFRPELEAVFLPKPLYDAEQARLKLEKKEG